MFSRIGRHLKFANVVMTLALVFAMTGGAYAAGKYLITSSKQIKPSVLAQLKGRAGANGAPGAQGPAGPAGPTGKEGSAGKEGPAGKEGEKGAAGGPGESVTTKKVDTTSSNCKKLGGSEFKVGGATATYACNGENGQTGFTETLPSGKTLTGEWSVSGYAEVGAKEGFPSILIGSVSFDIPLAQAPVPHYIKAGASPPAGCGGGSVAHPEAEPGNLCVFVDQEENNTTTPLPKICSFSGGGSFGGGLCAFGSGESADRYGFGVNEVAEVKGFIYSLGTWAVTAK
jgi:hypothetical protein